jgi:23S rRNA pseudouridine2605 synthase
MKERLQKVLSERGIASRREAERMILAGRVMVNNSIASELGSKADPDLDRILVDGKSLPEKKVRRILMMHKPSGYLCTNRIHHEIGHTVFELVPKDRRYFSIGRLDKDSSGLLLLTDDGELALHLSHPRYETKKVYLVDTKSEITAEQARRLRQGVLLEDGIARAEAISRLAPTRLRIVLIGGRKRQIRRMIVAIGSRVVKLHRIQVGVLKLGDLPEGLVRELTVEEIDSVRRGISRQSSLVAK